MAEGCITVLIPRSLPDGERVNEEELFAGASAVRSYLVEATGAEPFLYMEYLGGPDPGHGRFESLALAVTATRDEFQRFEISSRLLLDRIAQELKLPGIVLLWDPVQ